MNSANGVTDDAMPSLAERTMTVAAGRSLGSVLRHLEQRQPEWVVVVRSDALAGQVWRYAFRGDELRRMGDEHPDRLGWPLEQALDMHEWQASGVSRNGRLVGPDPGMNGPAGFRVIDLDAEGRVRSIEQIALAAAPSPPAFESVGAAPVPGDELDLGPLRGPSGAEAGADGGASETGAEPTPPPQPQAPAPSPVQGAVDLTLSAQCKAELEPGDKEVLDFRIELTSEAAPLAVATRATASAELPIVVSLSAENDVVEILKGREHTLPLPGAGRPATGFFLLQAVRPGTCRLALSFRQGGSELGVVALAVEVLHAASALDRTSARAVAVPRDPVEDDKLALLVEMRAEGGQLFYDYVLHSEALGLPYRRLRSKPLLDRGGGPAASTSAFVERIYERVTQELKTPDDLRQLQREARALGANLCQELFDPVVASELWPLRDRLRLVQVVSWEPYIPWELVRLRDPASGEIDERFLAEYGLVRTLSDQPPPRALPMRSWAYLGARFPSGSHPSVGAELDWFTGAAGDGLRARGIEPVAIEPTRDGFYDALAQGDFDVLHISCHAESPQDSIDRSSLIIGDETLPGSSKVRPIEIDTITVEAEARLKDRRPIVFLNACETGRMGAVLTAWGGWPNVFLRAGAGAFVGSSWPVRDKPAGAFAKALYEALLDGRTLAEAASAARNAARALGDVSWLAFKVYGHPRARKAS